MMQNATYVFRWIRSLYRVDHMPRPRVGRTSRRILTGSAFVVAGFAAHAPFVALNAGEPERTVGIETLIGRASVLGERLQGVEHVYDRDVEPLENVLLDYRNDRALARRIAVSLVREGAHTDVEPSLLLAVLLVENPWLDPNATSPVGARGLMQVMPFHRGAWGDCAPRLDDVEANICHGARIFASYLKATRGDVHRALLRYNGCVTGSNTPDCHLYPSRVYARAGRAVLRTPSSNAADRS
jgi:hypothetical protein